MRRLKGGLNLGLCLVVCLWLLGSFCFNLWADDENVLKQTINQLLKNPDWRKRADAAKKLGKKNSISLADAADRVACAKALKEGLKDPIIEVRESVALALARRSFTKSPENPEAVLVSEYLPILDYRLTRVERGPGILRFREPLDYKIDPQKIATALANTDAIEALTVLVDHGFGDEALALVKKIKADPIKQALLADRTILENIWTKYENGSLFEGREILYEIGPPAAGVLSRTLRSNRAHEKTIYTHNAKGEEIRVSVVSALEQFRNASNEVVTNLAYALLKDQGDIVRAGAAQALGTLATVSARPALEKALLKDSDAKVRNAAARALHFTGPADPRSLKTAMLSDSDSATRKTAMDSFAVRAQVEDIPTYFEVIAKEKDAGNVKHASEIVKRLIQHYKDEAKRGTFDFIASRLVEAYVSETNPIAQRLLEDFINELASEFPELPPRLGRIALDTATKAKKGSKAELAFALAEKFKDSIGKAVPEPVATEEKVVAAAESADLAMPSPDELLTENVESCPYCKTDFKKDEDCVRCEACNTAHHSNCWANNKKCTIHGCESDRAGAPYLYVPPPKRRLTIGFLVKEEQKKQSNQLSPKDQLFLAVARRDVAEVERLLKKYERWTFSSSKKLVNEPDAKGHTLLMVAAVQDDVRMIHLLQKRDADKMIASPDGATALSLARANGAAGAVELLKPSPDELEQQNNELLRAIQENNTAAIQLALARGADPSSRPFEDVAYGVVMALFEKGNLRAIKMLLDGGLKPMQLRPHPYYYPAFEISIIQGLSDPGALEFVKLCAERGFSLSNQLLIEAVKKGRTQTALFLIAHNWDIHVTGKDGKTVFAHATELHNLKVLAALQKRLHEEGEGLHLIPPPAVSAKGDISEPLAPPRTDVEKKAECIDEKIGDTKK